jgi:cytochrome oxidase Cu insertion factor (SCO1/SenC/PrrC family)
MKRFVLPVVVAALLALVGAALVVRLGAGPDPRVPDPGYGSFEVTGFDLIDQDGEPVDESILEGRFTVMDFFFTNCPIYCPVMGQTMRRVQDATEGTGIRLLSVSVDGERDTPGVISAYGSSLGADPERWRFVTGDPAEVKRLAEEQLKLGLEPDPSRRVELGDGSSMDFIDHPTRLVLIGPERRVLGMYSYASEDEIELLIERLRAIGG